MIFAEENYGKPLEPEVCIFTGIYHPRLKIEESTIDTENGMTNMTRKELLEIRDVPYDLRPDYTLGEGK